jgi:hypothetical protein
MPPHDFDALVRHYAHATVAPGMRLHVIDAPDADGVGPQLVSVYVVFDCGSQDLVFGDGGATRIRLPPGSIHFLEHLLFWTYLDPALREMENRYVAEINAVVLPHRTVFFAKNAWMQDAEPLEFVVALVRDLLTVALNLRGEAWTGTLEHWIHRTRNDIRLEIGHRSTLPYRMERALFSAMYHAHGLREDPLGSPADLDRIGVAEAVAGQDALRGHLSSLIVLGASLPDALPSWLVTALEDALQQIAGGRRLRSVSADDEPPEVARRWVNQVASQQSDHAIFDCGWKLPPLDSDFPEQRQRARLRVLSHLLGRGSIREWRIPYLTYPGARMLRVSGSVSPKLLHWDPVERGRFVDRRKRALIDKFEHHTSRFDTWATKRLVREATSAGGLLSLCELADADDLALREVIERGDEIVLDDLRTLQEEVATLSRKQVSVVYASSDADL